MDKALAKKLGKSMAQQVFSYISARPGLRYRCINAASKLGLYEPLRLMYRKFRGHRFAGHHHSPAAKSLAHMTPRARRIYADLKAAIEKNKEVS
jgi:hypothetical protein